VRIDHEGWSEIACRNLGSEVLHRPT
jgi:hypothetical protein